MADQRYAERTGELQGGRPQPPERELLVPPNPGNASWASPAAERTGAAAAGLRYGAPFDQPGSTGSAGFAGVTAAGKPPRQVPEASSKSRPSDHAVHAAMQ